MAESLANIGVAWFTAGIIAPLIGGARDLGEIVSPVITGLSFSALFILLGFQVMKGVR